MRAITKPNWLFRILVCISLGIHALIFARISEVYTSPNLTFIELTLQDISDSTARIIPRPRCRRKKSPQPVDENKITHTMRLNKLPKPIKMKSMKIDCPNSAVECIGGSEVFFPNELGLVQWNPNLEPFVEYETANSYLEMVKLRIERKKKYPESARSRQLEGYITIRFIIKQNGSVGTVEIVKKSGHDSLNKAALASVKKAAPFQKPPSRFFEGDITLKVTIVFELI